MSEDQSTRIRKAGWTPCPWSTGKHPRVFEHPDFKNPKGADEITTILDREQAARAEGVAEGRRLEQVRFARRVRGYSFGDEDDITLAEGGAESEILDRIARHAEAGGE